MSEGFWSLRNAPAWWFDKRAWYGIAVMLVVLLGSRWYYGPQRVPAGQVVVYGTAWCPYCKALREHLTASKIPFVDRDVEASFENAVRFMWAAGKGAGVPVMQVGPKVVAKGYFRRQIDEALRGAGYQPVDDGAGAEGASQRR